MAGGRKRSTAKQARRDARRRKARRGGASDRHTPEEAPLIDEVREALEGQPIDLLGLVSTMILATAPQELTSLRRRDPEDHASLDELVAAFIDVQVPETTALLAALGELVLDDDVLRARCRREVDARDESLPPWLAELAKTSVYRVVRMTHVLGDGDELLVGVRFADGQEMTCAVYIDHLTMSEVNDAFFVPDTINAVLEVGQANNNDPDTSFIETDLADARARLQNALDQPLAMMPLEESDSWPAGRPLLQWLTQLMPVGSSTFELPQHDSTLTGEVLGRFFASLVGLPFDDIDHRELLEICIEEGTGDPLRWSAARLRELLGAAVVYDNVMPLEVQLDAPELLRAFVPFAHAASGIRQELTVEALAAIDEAADDYRAMVVEDAEYWADRDDDDDDGTALVFH